MTDNNILIHRIYLKSIVYIHMIFGNQNIQKFKQIITEIMN
jgi:hypothetical protein